MDGKELYKLEPASVSMSLAPRVGDVELVSDFAKLAILRTTKTTPGPFDPAGTDRINNVLASSARS